MRFALAVLMLIGVFGGRHVYQQLTSGPHAAQDIANSVGTVYGDPHPHILSALLDQTEGPNPQPLYSMTVVGHFRNGNRTARYLEFSALANGRSAGPLWAGKSLTHRAQRSWFVNIVPRPPGQA